MALDDELTSIKQFLGVTELESSDDITPRPRWGKPRLLGDVTDSVGQSGGLVCVQVQNIPVGGRDKQSLTSVCLRVFLYLSVSLSQCISAHVRNDNGFHYYCSL